MKINKNCSFPGITHINFRHTFHMLYMRGSKASILCRRQQMLFKWRFAGGPMMARL